MKDKIKIYITKELKDLLLKDAKNFGFRKQNGETNQNSFLNTLIIHYYEEFKDKQRKKEEYIQSILENSTLSNKEIINLSQLLSKETNQLNLKKSKSGDTVSISIKPTKASEGIIEYIESYLLQDATISSYYHSMFASYAQLPQDRRERILFKDKAEKIIKAISKNKTIALTMNNGSTKYKVAPYKIASSFEETHNYLLCKTFYVAHDGKEHINNQLLPLRLSKIENIIIHDEVYIFSELEIATFGRALRNGVQFLYHESDKEIQVMLNEEKGIWMFDRFYVHRPNPIKIEGNVYTFDCCYDQIINYFARFGENATIITPIELKNKMIELHKNAIIQYEK